MQRSPITANISSNTTSGNSASQLAGGQPIAAMEIENDSSQALNSFKVQAQDYPNGEWYDYLTSTDFSAGAGGNLLFILGSPATLASSSKAHIHFRSNGVYAFRFYASVASGTVSVLVNGGKIDL